MTPDLERLVELAMRAKARWGDDWYSYVALFSDAAVFEQEEAAYIAAASPSAILVMGEALAEKDKRTAELREALKPFAKAAMGYVSAEGQHDYLDSDALSYGVTAGDLRHARAALKEE